MAHDVPLCRANLSGADDLLTLNVQAMHPPGVGIVRGSVMLGKSIIPYADGIRGPAIADLDVGHRRQCAKHVNELRALQRANVQNLLGEDAIHVQPATPGARVDANHGMNALVL